MGLAGYSSCDVGRRAGILPVRASSLSRCRTLSLTRRSPLAPIRLPYSSGCGDAASWYGDRLGQMDRRSASRYFFVVLYALVFSPTRIVPVWVAYDVQDKAPCLAVARRCFSGRLPHEQRFLRILGIYLLTYGGMSILNAELYRQTDSFSSPRRQASCGT